MKTSVKSASSNTAVDRRLALVLFAFTLGWYARTLPPGLLLGDAGEFQFAAWRFGLAHPTGYPLYLILGGLWQHLLALFGVAPAAALNLFSAVTGAAVIGLLYLLLARSLPGSGWGRLSALFAALLLAFNPTFWSQSIVAEVYALHALFIVSVLLAGVRLAGGQGQALTFWLLLGLSFTHHRSSLFLLPGALVLWLWFAPERPRGRLILGAVLALALPQLLYGYIPLRSGPAASPWLYPQLNGEVLALYRPGWPGFIDHLTGRVFAVSLLDVAGALARLPQMAELWLLHFSPTGLALMAMGLVVLVHGRHWALLILTVPFALLLQIFNLFYGIGDIYVYYIPLYVVGAVWAGCGVWGVGRWLAKPQTAGPGRHLILQFGLFAALLYFTVLPLTRYYAEVDQSGNNAARQMWDAILDAAPPADAVLISNDRNEIVPLYYLQAVESRAPGLTGLFPLLTPEDRFGDVGAVVQTALAAGERPVYLIKPMAGLAVRYELEAATPPLVRVLGPVTDDGMAHRLGLPYGPLTLLGYDWQTVADGVDLTLYWQVEGPIDGDYTTTVQLFAAGDERLAQSDGPPGHPYYPTSLWKKGEIVRERHTLALDGRPPASVLVTMYRQAPPAAGQSDPQYIHMAPSLTWPAP